MLQTLSLAFRATIKLGLAAAANVLALTSVSAGTAPADLVNPWIGTGRAGNTYPGAQAPFGMISWSPSTTFADYEDPYSRPGYKSDRSEIYGFALTHISGVGCHAAQDMPIMPMVGALDRSPVKDRDAYKGHFDHAYEEAHPGYYKVQLDDIGAEVELTVSERAGLGRFTFAKPGDRSIILRPTESINNLAGASIRIDERHRQLSGFMRSGGFCSRSPLDNPYTLYFAIEFDQPITAKGFWRGQEKLNDTSELAGDNIDAYVTFGSSVKTVRMKIGLSYVSEANARANLAAEIPGWDFSALRRKTEARWNELLERVEVKGPVPRKAVLYTALYHNLLQPSLFDDVTGDYIGFDGKVHQVQGEHHQYANYSNWDTYRTSAQLQGLLYPEIASDMISSLIRDARESAPHGLPIWGYYNHDANIMNGCSGIPFVVNAWEFGAHDVNLREMRDALLLAGTSQYDHGEDYIKHGYVPSLKSPWNFCVSMTVEFSIDDFCVSRFCASIGDRVGERQFLKRSQSVFNLLDPEIGFLRPREQGGAWSSPFQPTQEVGFNEGNSTQYTWSAPQNTARLVRMIGGNEKVERRLDSFLSKILVDGWNTQEPYFWPSNEPCFGVPYVYCWTGSPWKTQAATRRIRNLFTDDADGIPGDDDVGATSAYYFFNALGLYPSIPGVAGFAITAPEFPEIVLHLPHGHEVILEAPNADQNHSYIKSLKLAGKNWDSSWVALADLYASPKTVMRFSMDTTPNKTWAANDKGAPPSFDFSSH